MHHHRVTENIIKLTLFTMESNISIIQLFNVNSTNLLTMASVRITWNTLWVVDSNSKFAEKIVGEIITPLSTIQGNYIKFCQVL